MNIGTIAGGRAPNVIPDLAKAEIMVRLVGDPAPVREAFVARSGGTRGAERGAVHSGDAILTGGWACRRRSSRSRRISRCLADLGRAALLGPGSIHVAHTSEERISKKELRTPSRFMRTW